MIPFGSLWSLNTKPENFRFETVKPAEPLAPSLDPKDTASHAKLVAIKNDGAYLEQGLTISGLAVKIQVPEHQSQSPINRGLGYRNFAAWK